MDTNEKRYWDIPAVLLLMATVWVAALRLWATDWTQHLERVELLAMLGWLLGVALGKSRFRYRAVRWIALLYSIILIPWQLGLTMEEGVRWGERLPSLFGRLSVTFSTFVGNQPVQDPILFIASMGLLFWLISLIGGYQLVRYGRPWTPLAVSAIAVLLIEFYHPYITRTSLLTAVFFFFALMLIGRLYYLFARDGWEKNHVSVEAEVGFDLSRSTLLAGLLIVVMAWNFPTLISALTPGTAEAKWVDVSWQGLRNRLSNMVVSLQSPVSSSSNDFGNTLGLGTGAQLGDETTLIVTPLSALPEGMRMYWRGHSYDTFTGTDWQNTLKELSPVEPSDEALIKPPWGPVQAVDVSIQSMLGYSTTLYVPGQALSVSRPGQAQLHKPSDEGPVDVISISAAPAIRSGEIYEVTGLVSTPTAYQLQNSTGEYPQWVRDYYLQLPTNFSPRISEMANRLTVGYDNPYDRVVAITNYLRDNIEYATTIPSAPPDRDPIEWFLFDLRQGYCNYYATAEVLMLRSIGIPARLATGYAEGQAGEKQAFFIVQRKDSHAWPEVFFQGAGWVPFEPTVSQPELVLPAGGEEGQAAAAETDPLDLESLGDFTNRDRFSEDPGVYDSDFGNIQAIQRFPYQWLGLGVLLLALSSFFLYRWRQQSLGRWKPLPLAIEHGLRRRGFRAPAWLAQWARFSELSPFERIFAGVSWMIRILGGRPGANQTPSEQVDALVSLLPDGRKPAGIVLSEYQRSIYSPHPANLNQAKAASTQLWKQVFQAWLHRRFGIEIQVT